MTEADPIMTVVSSEPATDKPEISKQERQME